VYAVGRAAILALEVLRKAVQFRGTGVAFGPWA
jgi:hypothetical protein